MNGFVESLVKKTALPTDCREEIHRGEDLRERFDAVVMLTWSNWKTEPRSNRYHYATRFAAQLPVIFVQPDSSGKGYSTEATEVPNVTILHIAGLHEPASWKDQVTQVADALADMNIVRPLLWVYNSDMVELVRSIWAPLKVYHATEDYLDDPTVPLNEMFRSRLQRVLDSCDVLVAVSEEIRDLYVTKGRFEGRTVVATNGCDFDFFANGVEVAEKETEAPPRKVAFYQGGINHRLDFDLLTEIALRMPDWHFEYCGRVAFAPEHAREEAQWEELCALPNVTYLGFLDPVTVRAHMHRAAVGIIPFVWTKTLIDRSFPLKAFEYVACGLPVVTVPVKALQQWPELFYPARTAREFVDAIEFAAPTRRDPEAIRVRLKHADAKSYDRQFQSVCRVLRSAEKRARAPRTQYNVLVLHDERLAEYSLVAGHLRAMGDASRHRLFFVSPFGKEFTALDLADFDAVVIHHSLNILDNDCFLACRAHLRRYRGLKILLSLRGSEDHGPLGQRAQELNVHVVFAPEASAPVDGERFTVENYRPGLPRPAIERDPSESSMRGRDIDLLLMPGSETAASNVIRDRIVESAARTGVSLDVRNDPVRADQVRPAVARARAAYLPETDGENDRDLPTGVYRLSALMYEAITAGTVLVLTEGSHRGLTHWRHYLSLQRDLSNVDQILEQLNDVATLSRMARDTYQDLFGGDSDQVETLVRQLDRCLDEHIGPGNGGRPLTVLIGFSAPVWDPVRLRTHVASNPSTQLVNHSLKDALDAELEHFALHLTWKQTATMIWYRVPYRIRYGLSRLKNWPFHMLRNLWLCIPPELRRRLKPHTGWLRQALRRLLPGS